MSRADRVQAAPLARREQSARDLGERSKRRHDVELCYHGPHYTDYARLVCLALKKYSAFCEARDVVPSHVDPVWIALYITVVTSSVKISSMNGYLAAIHNEKVLRGYL